MQVPVNRPVIRTNDIDAVVLTLKEGWVSSEGPVVSEFESIFAKTVNHTFGIAVSSGTAALEIAIKALGVGAGDEVIVPTGTIISCAQAITKLGATPVFVDLKFPELVMDMGEVEEKITKDSKAILVVHLYGNASNSKKARELSDEHGLYLIEDCAQAIGLNCYDNSCGSYGDVSTFSFYSNKLITTGEGGMIVTSSPWIKNKCQSYRNLSFNPEKRFVHEELSWNYRMSSLQAALGISQVSEISVRLEIKRKIADKYSAAFKDIDNVTLPIPYTEAGLNGYWAYTLVLKDDYSEDAKSFCNKLIKKGIGTRPLFFPVNKQPVYKNEKAYHEEYDVSERLHKQGFYIPCGLGITSYEQEYVIESVIKLI